MPFANYEKQKEFQRNWVRKNRTACAYRGKIRREKGIAFAHRVKTRFGCVDCGYNDNPVALTFDHVRGEKKRTKAGKPVDISSMYMYKLSSLKEEMRKCVVRCASCHNIVTSERKHEED